MFKPQQIPVDKSILFWYSIEKWLQYQLCRERIVLLQIILNSFFVILPGPFHRGEFAPNPRSSAHCIPLQMFYLCLWGSLGSTACATRCMKDDRRKAPDSQALFSYECGENTIQRCAKGCSGVSLHRFFAMVQ